MSTPSSSSSLPQAVWDDVMPLLRGVWDAHLEDPHPRITSVSLAEMVAWLTMRASQGPLLLADARNIQTFYLVACRTGVPRDMARLLRPLGQF